MVAACLIVAEDRLAALGLTPIGYLVGWAVAGCEPSHMGIGPVPAVAKLLRRSGLRFDQMDLIELNEAFASQSIAVILRMLESQVKKTLPPTKKCPAAISPEEISGGTS